MKNSTFHIPHSTFHITLLMLFIWGNSGFSQSSLLFTQSTLTDAQLSTSQLKIKQSYQSGQNVASVNLINLASPVQIQQMPAINLRLPNDTITYTFTGSKLEAFSNGDFYWYGDLSEASGYFGQTSISNYFTGSLTILGRNGQVFGEMRIDTSWFGIPALGDNLNALVKYNNSEGNSECISGGGVISDANEIIDEREQCPNVDVLILYTQAALNAYPDIISRAYLAFSNTVTALTNSVVPKSRLNPNLVGVQLVSGFEPTGMWGADTTTIIGANSAVRMLRNAYNADLVLIMVPEVYTFFSGAVINFGDSEADGNNHAFAVVETGFANAPTYTFAHEFAHLFGCRHQLDTDCYLNHDNSGLSDAHAHNWGKGFHLGLLNFQRYYRTIVNACNYGQYAKILYYSNPGVEFNGKETGVAGESNNAKILRNAACRIANYRESHAINVNIINGPIPFTCPGYSISLTGTAFGGFGPYQFYWKYRLGNGAWIDYNPNNSQSTFNYTIPGNFYGMIYVELTVTNGTDYATSSTWAYADYLKCPHYRPSSNERDEKEPEGFPADFQIIPNPAINNIQIQLDTPIKQDIEVVVTNLTGEVCILETLNKNGQDIQNFQIDVAKLPAGLYLIRLNQSGTSGRVHKFAITGK